MTQKAIVKQLQNNCTVLVSLMRQRECGLNCDSCEGCSTRPGEELLASAAYSGIDVRPGELVEIKSNTASASMVALLVFGFPCLGVAIGYLVGYFIGLGSAISILLSFVGAVLGFIPAYCYNLIFVKRGKPEFTVVRILR